MSISIPRRLSDSCRAHPAAAAWLRDLPESVTRLKRAWSLEVGPPIDSDEVSCSWVAPARRRDGTSCMLKLGMPHMEAAQEIDGLRFWGGDPTVRIMEWDYDANAMLLELCEPGGVLRALPEPEQDEVIARMLRRLWRTPADSWPFQPLAAMLAHWAEGTLARRDQWEDAGLAAAGLHLFDELARTAERQALLATDLHAGNVLAARREPWLVIDPKPFVGDIAYDATQHLLNCDARLRADPAGVIGRFADLLEIDSERVRLWLFARAAAETGACSDGPGLARLLDRA